MTDTLRDKLIQKGWVTPFNVDTLVRLIEEHYADEPAAPAGREPTAVTRQPNWRGLCAELVDAWLKGDDIVSAMNRARVALAEADEPAVPAPPADGEVAELVDEARYLVRELSDQADDLDPSLELFGLMHQAAANLARSAELLQRPVADLSPAAYQLLTLAAKLEA